jgi:hypothetical protein
VLLALSPPRVGDVNGDGRAVWHRRYGAPSADTTLAATGRVLLFLGITDAAARCSSTRRRRWPAVTSASAWPAAT